MSEAATLSDAVLSDRAIMQMVVGGLSGPSLVPVSLEAREAISTPFEIRLEFVSHVPRLAADAFLYRPVLVTLQRNVPAPRYFHGAARRFTTLGPDKRDNWHYAIDIVPQIWFMKQTENCRFFENCSVKDIVSTLLGNIGVGFSFRLHETPAVREYTVQYNETDFAFISRLLEEEGYFYFFQHSPDGHELVIAESNIAFQTIPDSKLTFRPGQKDYDKLATLHAWTATAVGSVTLGDYDPTGVNKPLPGTEATILGASGAVCPCGVPLARAGIRHRRCRGAGAAAHRGGGSLRGFIRGQILERGLRPRRHVHAGRGSADRTARHQLRHPQRRAPRHQPVPPVRERRDVGRDRTRSTKIVSARSRPPRRGGSR